MISSVQPHDRPVRIRDLPHYWDCVRNTLRLIYDDVDQAVVALELKRAGKVPLAVEPGSVAELHGDIESSEHLSTVLDMVEVLRMEGCPRCKLHMNSAELAGATENFQHAPEARPQLTLDFVRHVLVVDVLLALPARELV